MHYVYKISLNDRPKRCKMCVCIKKRFRLDGPLISCILVNFSAQIYGGNVYLFKGETQCMWQDDLWIQNLTL